MFKELDYLEQEKIRKDLIEYIKTFVIGEVEIIKEMSSIYIEPNYYIIITNNNIPIKWKYCIENKFLNELTEDMVLKIISQYKQDILKHFFWR